MFTRRGARRPAARQVRDDQPFHRAARSGVAGWQTDGSARVPGKPSRLDHRRADLEVTPVTLIVALGIVWCMLTIVRSKKARDRADDYQMFEAWLAQLHTGQRAFSRRVWGHESDGSPRGSRSPASVPIFGQVLIHRQDR
jgi:hypothetical protein